MSQRQEVEGRRELFAELSGILGAMRSFAMTELRRITKREAAQQQVVESLTNALDDLSTMLPAQLRDKPGAGVKDIYLLFGSVRGFCGGFNEDVLRLWQAQSGNHGALILLGERLHDLFVESDEQVCIAGADSGLEAVAAIDPFWPQLSKFEAMTIVNFVYGAVFVTKRVRRVNSYGLCRFQRPHQPGAIRH